MAAAQHVAHVEHQQCTFGPRVAHVSQSLRLASQVLTSYVVLTFSVGCLSESRYRLLIRVLSSLG